MREPKVTLGPPAPAVEPGEPPGPGADPNVSGPPAPAVEPDELPGPAAEPNLPAQAGGQVGDCCGRGRRRPERGHKHNGRVARWSWRRERATELDAAMVAISARPGWTSSTCADI
jgi:hypothetical protein